MINNHNKAGVIAFPRARGVGPPGRGRSLAGLLPLLVGFAVEFGRLVVHSTRSPALFDHTRVWSCCSGTGSKLSELVTSKPDENFCFLTGVLTRVRRHHSLLRCLCSDRFRVRRRGHHPLLHRPKFRHDVFRCLPPYLHLQTA